MPSYLLTASCFIFYFRKERIVKNIIIFLLLSFCYVQAADSGSIAWAKIYGSGYDLNYGESFDITSDGGGIVAGYKEVFKKSNIFRTFLVRTDSNGDTLWTREYDGMGEICYSVQQTGDGGFILAGKMGFDASLIRTDSNGDTLWTKRYGYLKRAISEEGYCVDQTHDGGFVMAGYTTHVKPPNYNVYIVRTDSTGDTLWTKTYWGGRAQSVQQTIDKGFVLTGNYTDSINHYEYQLFITKTDSIGDTLWMKIYGDTSNLENGYCVRQTNDGGYIISGQKNIGGNLSALKYLIRTDSLGDTLWSRTYKSGRAYSVEQTKDGGFIVASTNGYFHVMKTDPNGVVLWEKSYGHPRPDQRAKSVKQTKDGGYIAAGWGRLEPDSTGTYFLLVKYDSLPVEINNNSLPEPGISQVLKLSCECKGNTLLIKYLLLTPGFVNIEVFDVLGKSVRVITNKYIHKGEHVVRWNLRSGENKAVANGIYLVSLSVNGYSISRKITIVK